MTGAGRGAIISIASLLAFSGESDNPHLPKRAVYAGTKSFIVTWSEIVATELDGTGVRVQVVCPGMVRTEFHDRQGIDVSAVPRMEPEAIVTASLLDLERGVVVCVPGLDDAEKLARVATANGQMLQFTRTVELPARYPRDGSGP
jgi:short-subunit dehydrogenase